MGARVRTPARWRVAAAAVTLLLGAGTGARPATAGTATGTPTATGTRTATGTAWSWPLDGASRGAVSRAFDPPATAYGTGHRGVDLVGASGAPVRAVGAGRVSYAGLLAGRGVVVVVHGDLRTTYEPVTASVPAGAEVTTGAELGTLDGGHPGCPAAACLHWGLRRGEQYLDPLRLVDVGPVRLLPLDGLAARSDAPVGVPAADRAAPEPSARAPAAGQPPAAGQEPPWRARAAQQEPSSRAAQQEPASPAPAAPQPPASGAAWESRSSAAAAGSLLAVALLAALALRRSWRRPPPPPAGGAAALRPVPPPAAAGTDVVSLEARRRSRAVDRAA